MRRWAWLGWFAAGCGASGQPARGATPCEGLRVGDRPYAFVGETVDLCGPQRGREVWVDEGRGPGACPPERGSACSALEAPLTAVLRAGVGLWTAPSAPGPVFLQLAHGGAPDAVIRVAVIDRSGDEDGDGLSNEVEHLGGLDPLDPDVDDDGLSDGDEVRRGTPPRRPDIDGDGLLDGEEIGFGSDPQRADSDGDGLADAGEFTELTDPRDRDTDGDGLSDGEEVLIWRTSPRRADTDLDGVEDGAEVAAGTAPRWSDGGAAGSAGAEAASGALRPPRGGSGAVESEREGRGLGLPSADPR
jgi:hypothetical protein